MTLYGPNLSYVKGLLYEILSFGAFSQQKFLCALNIFSGLLLACSKMASNYCTLFQLGLF